MKRKAKNLSTFTDKPLAPAGIPQTTFGVETPEEMDQRLLGLLGEVIRMSQAWVRALESGDPFTADKCEEECVLAMERFEANRQKGLARSNSFEQTR